MSKRVREFIPKILALALAAGCGDEQVPATQVIVTVNSNLEVGAELTRVEVSVLDADGGATVATHPFELTRGAQGEGKVRLPFSLGIEKKKADRFRLDVIGYGPAGAGGESHAVIEQKLKVAFRDRETLLLKVFLDATCFERLCTGARTCYAEAEGGVAAGTCGELREAELTPVQPGTEHSGWTTSGGRESDAGTDSGAPPGGRGAAGDAGAPRAGRTGGSGTGGSDAAAGTGTSGTSAEAGAEAAGMGAAGEGGTNAAGTGASGSGGAGACQPAGEQLQSVDDPDDYVTTTQPSDYASQPPSSGPRCEASGVYGTYPAESPLLPCNFVRNLEKGAIVLLYNCPTPCPELVAALEQVVEDAIDDPDCTPVDDLQRLLITPYSAMDATFAAVSWGVTWTSSCPTLTPSDHAALLTFIEDHWGTHGAAPYGNDCSYGTIYPSTD